MSEESDIISAVVNYLNAATDSRYRANNPANRKMIGARAKEGATIEDFKAVIDFKSDEWMHTEMEQYLRPSTLFCPSHFENYLSMALKSKRPAPWQESSVKAIIR